MSLRAASQGEIGVKKIGRNPLRVIDLRAERLFHSQPRMRQIVQLKHEDISPTRSKAKSYGFPPVRSRCNARIASASSPLAPRLRKARKPPTASPDTSAKANSIPMRENAFTTNLPMLSR